MGIHPSVGWSERAQPHPRLRTTMHRVTAPWLPVLGWN